MAAILSGVKLKKTESSTLDEIVLGLKKKVIKSENSPFEDLMEIIKSGVPLKKTNFVAPITPTRKAVRKYENTSQLGSVLEKALDTRRGQFAHEDEDSDEDMSWLD
jgi:hypothetical protein